MIFLWLKWNFLKVYEWFIYNLKLGFKFLCEFDDGDIRNGLFFVICYE